MRLSCAAAQGGTDGDRIACERIGDSPIMSGASPWSEGRAKHEGDSGRPGGVVAQSDDTVECKGYQYFPPATVRLDWLEKTAKTADDNACPHGVQFYDVVVGGTRHRRAAWSYEAPRPEMQAVGGRFGFWQDVEVS